jgi:hypothetical protein
VKNGHLSNEAAQGRIRENDRLRSQRVETAIQDAMKSEQGRILMHHIIFDLLGLQAVCAGDTSERTAALWEGRRWGAATLSDLVKLYAPEQYALMEAEHFKRLRADNEIRSSASKAVTEDNDA